MIRDLLDDKFVLRQRKFLIQRLKTEAQALDSGAPGPSEKAAEHAVDPGDLRQAAALLENSTAGSGDGQGSVYLPGDTAVSLMQYCLEQAYLESGLVVKPQISGYAATGGVEAISDLRLPPELANPPEIDGLVAFEEGDPRYISGYLLAKASKLLKNKPKFKDVPARVQMKDKARVAIFGDWGSGILRAQTLAASIQVLLAGTKDRECHAIHIGDVYFAGFEDEYKDRVLPYWPGAAGRSWAIAGNHDIYTGGGPFLDTMLGDARLSAQQKCNWFVLENANWQLFGLDSAFDPPDADGLRGGLAGTQARQVHEIRRAAAGKGGVLLTHHQPFNVKNGAVSNHSPAMINALEPVLRAGQIRAWFWGHEHDAAVYRPWNNVAYPCLSGHAGVPEVYKERTPSAPERWRWPNHFESRDGTYFEMGFTVLDFDGDSMEVSFYNEHGVPVPFPDGPHVLKSK